MSDLGISIAVKVILESMGKPEMRTWVDVSCQKHMPTLWLPSKPMYRLIEECLTCWVEGELWNLKNKVQIPDPLKTDTLSDTYLLP